MSLKYVCLYEFHVFVFLVIHIHIKAKMLKLLGGICKSKLHPNSCNLNFNMCFCRVKETASKKNPLLLQDKYQRTLADRENVRNRLEKQIIEAKQFGIQGFCKDLLEVW